MTDTNTDRLLGDAVDRAYRDRALDLAVRWTERHLTPGRPEGIVHSARVFEAYLRGDEAAQEQDDAAEGLVEKAARVIAVDSPPDALDYDTARNLYAAGLLRGGDEQ